MNLFNNKVKLNIYQIIALVYFNIILIGSILLVLPISYRSDTSVSFMTAFFTATSAVCVTGLSLVDIYTTYTLFGQAVVLLLIEIGGLGFMSFVSILIHLTRHQNNVQALTLTAESLGSDTLMKSIGRIQKRLIIGSAFFQTLGAAILFLNFLPLMKWDKAIWFGLFHSVSAFCNAGFDLMGMFAKGSSLITFFNNPVVLITISVLIIVGGLGFVVWDNIVSSKSTRDWSIYTKLVLFATTFLIVIGTIMFYFFECNNAASIGNYSTANKVVNSIFQAVTPRTAGFAAIEQCNLTDNSIALTSILMLIGGSTGSTAGGIKTVTFLILVKAILSSAIGKKNVTLLKRTISQEQINQVYTLASCFIAFAIGGGFILSTTSGLNLTDCLFECMSALATVGLSLGITSSVSTVSKVVLIVFMFIGRVGLLTLTIGFFKAKENPAIKYPSVKLFIG